MLFAFAHGFPDSIALIPLAFALGYTYLRRRSYVTVMLVHFLFNGFNMLLALVALAVSGTEPSVFPHRSSVRLDHASRAMNLELTFGISAVGRVFPAALHATFADSAFLSLT